MEYGHCFDDYEFKSCNFDDLKVLKLKSRKSFRVCEFIK